MLELRVFAIEDSTSDTSNEEPIYHTMEVEFKSAIICPSDWAGGADCHLVESEVDFSGNTKIGIGWDFKGKQVYAVVSRYTAGDTLSITYGKWAVEDVFNTRKKAEKYMEDNRADIGMKYDDYFGRLEKIDIIELPFERIRK